MIAVCKCTIVSTPFRLERFNIQLVDENDNLVGSVWHYGALASGGHYQVTKPVYINHRIFGNYYFIVQTDDNNDVYEHLADQNGNIKATSVSIYMSVVLMSIVIYQLSVSLLSTICQSHNDLATSLLYLFKEYDLCEALHQ